MLHERYDYSRAELTPPTQESRGNFLYLIERLATRGSGKETGEEVAKTYQLGEGKTLELLFYPKIQEAARTEVVARLSYEEPFTERAGYYKTTTITLFIDGRFESEVFAFNQNKHHELNEEREKLQEQERWEAAEHMDKEIEDMGSDKKKSMDTIGEIGLSEKVTEAELKQINGFLEGALLEIDRRSVK